MKRFLVFYGEYYEAGGIDYFLGDFNDFDEAVKTLDESFNKETDCCAFIFDTTTKHIAYHKH